MKSRWIRVSAGLALVVCTFILIVVSSCGGKKAPGELPAASLQLSGETSDSRQLTVPMEPPLDDPLVELADAASEEGIPRELVEILGEMLQEKLAELSSERTTSRPPVGLANDVNDLVIASSDGGSITLTWSYRNAGDYNQDGVVNIRDLTPLARHFGESADEEGAWLHSVDEVIDGNGDGSITVDDITPLAAGFGTDVAGYRVEGAPSYEGPFATLTFTPLPVSDDDARTTLVQIVEVRSNRFFRVAPVDAAGEPGRASNLVHYGEQLEPLVLGVSPLTGYPGEEVQFSATVDGLPPFEYGWSFGHGADPNASLEESPTVTLRGLGEYSARVTVVNDYGTDRYDFTLAVTEPPPPPEPPEILGVAPSILTVGEPTKLAVVVTGTPPFNYSWNIEVLLDGVSTEYSPEVTAEETGTYPGQITVSGTYGEDTYGFVIRAAMEEDLPKILDVQPRTAYAGLYRQFETEVTGATPLRYRWDFGNAAEPSVRTERSPIVQFTGLPGDYPASLQAYNDYGADIYNFTITMKPHDDWTIQRIAAGYSIDAVSGILISGRPVVAYSRRANSLDETRELKFAQGPEDAIGPWEEQVVETAPSYPFAIALGEVGGNPAIAYNNSFVSGQPREVRVAMAVGPDPGEGDWSIHTVAEGSGSVDICEVDGRPAVVYSWHEYNAPIDEDHPTILYYAINTEPDGSGEWQQIEVTRAAGSFYRKSLRVFDGRPAIVYSEVIPNESRRLYWAIADAPDGLGEWQQRLLVDYPLPVGPSLPDDAQGAHSLIAVGGRPAVATFYIHYPGGGQGYLDTEMRYLLSQTVDGLSEWREATVAVGRKYAGYQSYIYEALAPMNGKPAMAFQYLNSADDPDNGGLWLYTTESADGVGEWEITSLIDTMGREQQLLNLSSGEVVVVYTIYNWQVPLDEQEEGVYVALFTPGQ